MSESKEKISIKLSNVLVQVDSPQSVTVEFYKDAKRFAFKHGAFFIDGVEVPKDRFIKESGINLGL